MLKGEMDTIGVDGFGVEVLMREMEELIVENKLKNESGPIGNAWARAVVDRSRARSMSL